MVPAPRKVNKQIKVGATLMFTSSKHLLHLGVQPSKDKWFSKMLLFTVFLGNK